MPESKNVSRYFQLSSRTLTSTTTVTASDIIEKSFAAQTQTLHNNVLRVLFFWRRRWRGRMVTKKDEEVFRLFFISFFIISWKVHSTDICSWTFCRFLYFCILFRLLSLAATLFHFSSIPCKFHSERCETSLPCIPCMKCLTFSDDVVPSLRLFSFCVLHVAY